MKNKGINFNSKYNFKDSVFIKPYGLEGKILSFWLKKEGLFIEVKFYKNAERKTEYFEEEELEFQTDKNLGF